MRCSRFRRVLYQPQLYFLLVKDLVEMDLLVNVEGLTPRAAETRWMEANADAVASWKPIE